MKARGIKRLSSSSFTEYFFYLTGLSILITALLGGSLYFYSASMLRKEAIANNNNSLRLLRNAQELVLAEVDKSMGNIFLDSFYASYMDYYYRQDMVTLQKLQLKLDTVLSTNNYIESAYVYYHKDRFVLSSGQGPVRLEDFNDRLFADGLTHTSFNKNYVRTRRISSFPAGEQTIITIVKAIPIFYTSKLPDAYVVVNIKGEYLQEMMDSIKTNQNAAVLVTDEAGNIITQKAGSNLGGLTVSGYMSLPPAKPEDAYVRKLEGTETLVSYITSDIYGWTYIYTIPMSAVTKSIRVWVKSALLIVLSVIGLSLLFSLLFSKWMAAPLKRLLFMLKSHAPDTEQDKEPPEHKEKEVAQIERRVTTILDRNRKLGQMLEEYEVYSKNKFLLSLLTFDEEVKPKTLETLNYYKLDLDRNGYYVTLLFYMDSYGWFASEHTEQSRNTLFLQLTDDLRTAALTGQKGFIAEPEAGHLALVLNYSEFLEPDEAAMLSFSMAKRLHAMLSEQYAYSFTLGVSSPKRGIIRLADSYREAEEALRSRMILGDNTVIPYGSIEKDGRAPISYPISIERHLLGSLKLGDSQAVFHYLAEFEAYIQQNATYMETVRSFFLQLFFTSLKCVYEMNSDFELGALVRNIRHTELMGEETMRGMAAYMSRVYSMILQHLESKRSQKNRELVAAVKQFVQDHLEDDLTVERLGEQFYISASYLRRIYKEESGETLKEYILAQRMERARQLLEQTEDKIVDIAEKVGYMSPQSFSKAFKLETGKTPVEFREERRRFFSS
ncbi:helix-turn-helix domain-containing protein [Paenibacillus sp. YN15]|uniref:helix-turn-helix domain-containing protein n=1 Tax=Paenibacillus sp. YN15 TaxID=1742774 RepID=UPI0015ECA950|nr:helix-turn-helix domain-containing protein [Paenibacillus sp. YN15]